VQSIKKLSLRVHELKKRKRQAILSQDAEALK